MMGYFIYTQGPVFGLWVYSEEEREEMTVWFEKIMRGREPEMVAVVVPEDKDDVPVKTQTLSHHGSRASSNGASSDIIGMLNRAAQRQTSTAWVHQQPSIVHQQPSNAPQQSSNFHQQPPNVLQQLFASAQASPSRPRHHTPPPAPPPPTTTSPKPELSALDVGAQLQRMVRFVAAKYPAMGPQQFRNTAAELIIGDEILWSELYAAYTQYQR